MKQVEDFVKNIKNMIWLMLNTKGVFMNGVIHFVIKNYEGFCMRCYIYKYPLKLVSRNYKTKEFTVVEFVKPISPIMNGLRIKSFRTGVRVADQIYCWISVILFLLLRSMRTNILTTTFLAKISVLWRFLVIWDTVISYLSGSTPTIMIGNEKITSCWEQTKLVFLRLKVKDEGGRNALKEKSKECLEKNGRIR
jgi:hypothetical protein